MLRLTTGIDRAHVRKNISARLRNLITALRTDVNARSLVKYVLIFVLIASYLRIAALLVPVVMYSLTESELILGLCYTVSTGLAIPLYSLLGRLVDKHAVNHSIVLSILHYQHTSP